MVSFICNYCQETIKKPKLDQHAQRCRNHSFSCVDCMTDFQGTLYREHTKCISEAEKYQKSQYRPPGQGKKQQQNENSSVTKGKEGNKRKASEDPVKSPPLNKKKPKTEDSSKDLLGTIKSTAQNLLLEKKKLSLSKLIKKVTKACQKQFPNAKSLKSTVSDNLFLSIDSDGVLSLN